MGRKVSSEKEKKKKRCDWIGCESVLDIALEGLGFQGRRPGNGHAYRVRAVQNAGLNWRGLPKVHPWN